MTDILIFVLAGAASYIGAFAAIKTDVTWIKRTLFHHDKRISNLELKGVFNGKNQTTF